LSFQVKTELLLLGVDGGGTRCRARVCDFSGKTLGGGQAGPANIRLGVEESLTQVLDATARCFRNAGISLHERAVAACLALAGASEPVSLAEFKSYGHPFKTAVYTTESHAACIGAHRGEDGGIIIVGTGSIGEAIVEGKRHRVGGWGFPVSDEGSGAWLGCEVARRALWALDGRAPWTPLLKRVAERFDSDPHAMVRWMSDARPGSFAILAPLAIEAASQGDPVGRELTEAAARHVDELAQRLAALGVTRIALSGGLATSIEPWLSAGTRQSLVPAAAGALAGAIELARAKATEGGQG
jgi:glucosamine kinase